jgi:hypothetical protein
MPGIVEDKQIILFKMSIINRLLKNPSHVIARSSFCDEAIFNPLILLKARLPRFARNDRKKTFSTGCQV